MSYSHSNYTKLHRLRISVQLVFTFSFYSKSPIMQVSNQMPNINIHQSTYFNIKNCMHRKLHVYDDDEDDDDDDDDDKSLSNTTGNI